MKFQNKLKLVAALVTGVAAVSSVHAAADTINASVVVNNAIDLTVVSPLDFGTVAAFYNDDTALTKATLTIPADPTAVPVAVDGPNGLAQFIVLSNGAPADISVTGAAPNTLLTVDVQSTGGILHDPANIANQDFLLANFTKYAYLEGNNQTFGSTTDATGALGMNIGGTITTFQAVGGNALAVAYTDATYTGVMQVTVDY